MPIDMSEASVKAPPRKTTRKSANAAPQSRMTMQEVRREGLMGLAQLAQAGCLMTHQYADAATIQMYGEPLAAEIAKLADIYDVIAKPVDLLIQAGPFAGLIAIAVPMTMQILANHKVIDAEKTVGSNIVPPRVLEAQMQAQVTKMQADAQRQQAEAMREAREAQAEYEKLLREETRDSTPVGV